MSNPGKSFRGRGRKAKAKKLRRTKGKGGIATSRSSDEGAAPHTTEALQPSR